MYMIAGMAPGFFPASPNYWMKLKTCESLASSLGILPSVNLNMNVVDQQKLDPSTANSSSTVVTGTVADVRSVDSMELMLLNKSSSEEPLASVREGIFREGTGAAINAAVIRQALHHSPPAVLDRYEVA